MNTQNLSLRYAPQLSWPPILNGIAAPGVQFMLPRGRVPRTDLFVGSGAGADMHV